MKTLNGLLKKGILAVLFLLALTGSVQAQQFTNEPTPTVNPDLIPSCGLDIIFIMDESGSIAGSGDATNVVTQARNGAKELLTALVGTNSTVAIVEFNRTARRAEVGGITGYQVVDNTTLPDFIDYLNANNGGGDAANYDPANAGNDGWTNWEDAFNEVEDILTTVKYAPLVIFFTDGKPTAYNNSQGGTTEGQDDPTMDQALEDAIGAANAVKTLGTHVFIVGLPNPDLPEGNCQAVTGPDRYLDLEPDFTKGDYTISSSQTLENDLRDIASLVCRADLRLSKSVYPAVVCPGTTVEFTIRVTNDGLEDATGVQAKDYLPSGYTYVSDDGAATTLSNDTLTWDIGNLDNGNFVTLHITATVNASGNYKNAAEVTATDLDDFDSDPANYNGVDDEDDEDEATVRFLECADNNPCTIDLCENGECVSLPGQLDINIDKHDLSCRCAASQDQLCLLDFAGLAHGEPVSEQYAPYGIHIFTKPTIPIPVTRPVVFNTGVSGTDDPDLEVNIGNIIIIPEIQNSADPDDAADGGEITFNFDHARTVLSFDAVDQDDGANVVWSVDAYDGSNNLIKSVLIPQGGNASVQTIQVNASGVRQLVFRIPGSGGIGNIRLLCDEPCCDGSATANTSGGTSQNKTYKWSDGQQTISYDQTISGLCPGTYYVTVTDESGCSAESSVTIGTPQQGECDNCQFDCAFECNGTAYMDGCGICVGGNTGKQPCGCYLQVTSATLMYEGTLGEIGPLTNGTVINRDLVCRVNVRANLCQSPVGSVKFVLNGNTTKIENGAPYAFWGDNNSSYKPWVVPGGNHTLVITAYSGLNATGLAGTPFVVNFSVTGSASAPACSQTPKICVGGCNDNNACTTDACSNGTCVYTQKNCNDNNACTNDYCSQGNCQHDQIQSQPSYLKVMNPAKSWRKLKLGYSSNSLYTPKKNVISGGNNNMCITLRTVGNAPEWNKIQIRPQGSASHTVTLSNYISGAQSNWTTICIPLNAFGGFNFSQISLIEIPYSNGAAAFEIHIQKIEFTGGSTPFLWFGDPHTNNEHDGSSGSGTLNVSLVAGAACGNAKMSNDVFEETSEGIALNAYPNPFKDNVTITFGSLLDEKVSVEVFSTDGKLVSVLFEGNVTGGESRSVDFNAGSLANGVYFYRMTTESGTAENRKLILIR